MFKTIVLAPDGSEHADKAIPFARNLAQASRGRLEVVYVREMFVGRGGAHPVHANEEELETRVAREVEALSRDGVDVRLHTASVATGGPAHAIADFAAETDADLVVVGTRGHTALGGLLLGSVTQRLLHLVHCPVLAIRPKSDAAGGGDTR